jgi:hypothetical protein
MNGRALRRWNVPPTLLIAGCEEEWAQPLWVLRQLGVLPGKLERTLGVAEGYENYLEQGVDIRV